jgi:hypothetical protein
VLILRIDNPGNENRYRDAAEQQRSQAELKPRAAWLPFAG